jgi:hypothetical protein
LRTRSASSQAPPWIWRATIAACSGLPGGAGWIHGRRGVGRSPPTEL